MALVSTIQYPFKIYLFIYLKNIIRQQNDSLKNHKLSLMTRIFVLVLFDDPTHIFVGIFWQ